MRRILGAVLVGVLVLSVATVALAQESPDQKEAKELRKSEKAMKELGFRILHGDSVGMTKDGKTVEVRHQRGVIEKVSNTSITLKSPDGYEQTYSIDGDTVVRVQRKTSAVDELKEGERAGVVATKSGDGYTVKMIRDLGTGREKRPEKQPAA